MLPLKREDLGLPHTGFERRDDAIVQVFAGRVE